MSDDGEIIPFRPSSRLSPRERRLAGLAASLGLELPPFEGPLDAFELTGDRGPSETIYLGGDLHTAHPEAVIRPTVHARDHSLDSARIALDDHEHQSLTTIAVEGIWCLAVGGELADSAPYFTLWDADGRLRAWLLLPPPRLMIGIGRFWLPLVPPPPDPGARPGDSTPAD
jgi:hypothetical protein